MSSYETILCAVSAAQESMQPTLVVSTLDLAELLAELASLRTGGGKPASAYSAEFEEAWAWYPTRPGNSKAAAFKAWKARLKAGASALEMIDGTMKYANYCKAERTEPQYIKQAATFYGPGEHFSADWTVKRSAAPAGSGNALPLVDQQRAANEEAKRRLGIADDLARAAGFIDIDVLRTIDATI